MTKVLPVGGAGMSDSEGDTRREWELLFCGSSGVRGLEFCWVCRLSPVAGVALVPVAVVVMEIKSSVTLELPLLTSPFIVFGGSRGSKEFFRPFLRHGL